VTQHNLDKALRGAPVPIEDTPLRILVVDDSALQRRLVTLNLKKWGFEIREAASGIEALKACETDRFDLIISDWVMPEMDGLEFCQEFRKLSRESYGYFILVTSKNEKNDVAKGLDAGADDFLSKPVNSAELKARIRAGTRVLEMEKKLLTQNETVNNALKELREVYDEISKDLVEASKLQHSLIPVRHKKLETAEMSLLFQSSGHVGGDLVGFFGISQNRLGLFSLDVSGHGISSALLTVRLAGYLNPHNKTQNIAFEPQSGGGYRILPPQEIAGLLNDRMMEEMDTEHYFTMAFADIDLETGHVVMVQAGHPHPVIFNPETGVRFLGSGGPPIGLLPFVEFENFEFDLKPGDRLFLYSDGVTECQNAKGALFDEDGLETFLKNKLDASGPEFMDDLLWQLTEFSEGTPFDDDISAILFEFERKIIP
jgi:sigma-B regulation protein RsbU (phosphoserine phosphatase)